MYTNTALQCMDVFNTACIQSGLPESLELCINVLMCAIYTAGNYEPPFILGELLVMHRQTMDTGWMERMENLWFCMDQIYNQNAH